MALSKKQMEEIANAHFGDAEPSATPESVSSLPIPKQDEKDLIDSSAETLKDAGEYSARKLMDLLLGAQEGYTFHVGKRALSKAEALLGLQKSYEEAMAKNQQALDEAAKRSPVLFHGGELGGALMNPLPGALAKTGGELVGLGKLARGIENLGIGADTAVGESEVLAKLAPKLQEKLAEKAIGTRLGETVGEIATGAGEGALLSGGSEAIEGDIKNVPKAMVGGGIVGGALPVGGKALSMIGDKLAEYPIMQKAIRAFKLEKGTPSEVNPEGKPVNISSETGQGVIVRGLTNAARKVSDSTKKLVDFAKKEYADFLKNNSQTVFKTTEHPELEDVFKLFSEYGDDPILKNTILGPKLFQHITTTRPDAMLTGKRLYSDVNLSQLSDIRSNLVSLGSKIENRELKDEIFKEGGVIDKISDAINNKFPMYTTLKHNIDMAALPAESLVGRTTNPDGRTVFFSDLPKEEQIKKLEDVSSKLIEGYFQGGLASAKKRETFDDFLNSYKRSVEHMTENSPSFAKVNKIPESIGDKKIPNYIFGSTTEDIAKMQSELTKPDNLIKGLQLGQLRGDIKSPEYLKKLAREAGADVAAVGAVEGIRPSADKELIPISNIVQSAFKGQIPMVGVPIVKTAKYAGKIAASPPVKAVEQGRQFTTQQLQKYADYLATSPNPSIANLGRTGAESLNKSSVGKSVFLNSIMSNPAVRKKLGIDLSDKSTIPGTLPIEEESKQEEKVPESGNDIDAVERILNKRR